jgi:hypothetical protein
VEVSDDERVKREGKLLEGGRRPYELIPDVARLSQHTVCEC